MRMQEEYCRPTYIDNCTIKFLQTILTLCYDGPINRPKFSCNHWVTLSFAETQV
jgi:hypothetical protein